MKKAISLSLVLSLLISCAGMESVTGKESGTFRGRWYNYYDRGIAYSEQGEWEAAFSSFRTSINKRGIDQRMARTYGMHYIDYFPHREVGIVLLEQGKIEDAIGELEISLSQEKSAKAAFYLNKARTLLLQQQGGIIAPPDIVVDTPVPYEALNSFAKIVKGKVTGNGYVAKIYVNGVPYRFDLAEQEISFEMNVDLSGGTKKIVVTAEDLLGSPSVKTVEINIDREGPAISIYDIAQDAGSRDTVRISGAVNDSTGISRLLMNNEAVATKDMNAYKFNIELDRKSLPEPFVIEAYDTLNNVTKAEIDIEKELMAVHVQDRPVLLAMTGADLFSTDESPPMISLKDAKDMPPVFVDTYYVEGEVSDNRKVENIYVNRGNVLTGKGKKIFFSKLVKLDEGENAISVEALDSSGNREEAGFTVTRKIPQVLQVGSRMSMSIMPFEIKDGENSVGLIAYDQLTGSFVNQKRFNVIEREKLEEVLLEQDLTRDKLTDPEYSIKVGRLISADTILATSVAGSSKSVEFTSRVINTETSEVMDVKDVYSEDISPGSIGEMMEGLASKVAGSFPLVEGIVIKSDKDIVYIDLGTKTGIKGDMGIIVYRPGEEIRHPLTGKYLGRDMESLGAAEIEEIHEEYSKAKLDDGNGNGAVKVHDMVITR